MTSNLQALVELVELYGHAGPANAFFAAFAAALFTTIGICGAVVAILWAIDKWRKTDRPVLKLPAAALALSILPAIYAGHLAHASIGRTEAHIAALCESVIEGISSGEIKAIDAKSSEGVVDACGQGRFLFAANSTGSKLTLASR
jgi:hypothetical protein